MKQLKEIRIHGRGGQGSVVTAELLAIAAFKEGLYSQAFPYLGGGGERRGAPVQAFCRIDSNPIGLKCQIEEPNHLIVQDASLLGVVDILKGMQPESLILVNSEQDVMEMGLDAPGHRVYTFPATAVALKVLQKPIMNTAMIGAFAVLVGDINAACLRSAIVQKFPGSLGEDNIKAMEAAYKLASEKFRGCLH